MRAGTNPTSVESLLARQERQKKPVRQFWRIWKYIWPQWHRLIIIVSSSVAIGMLFSVSFMTIIPLLKVMMGEEGLHGWIDRKCSNLRYGMDFHVPDRSDFLEEDSSIAYYLLVTGLEEEGLAVQAGLQIQDQIVDVGRHREKMGKERVSASKLLALLATAGDGVNLPIRVRRPGVAQPVELTLQTRKHPDDISPQEMGLGDRLEWGVKWAIVDRAQWVAGLIPRCDH